MHHAQYGNKWAMIAAQMKGRSTIALRNRWSFHMRHAYREEKQIHYRFVVDNRNPDFNQQQPIQMNNQIQLQLIHMVPGPYNQVQQKTYVVFFL